MTQKGKTISSSSAADPLPGHLVPLVPLDMIEAWLRGEYLTGQNESIGYEYLGWALMLRGAYLYKVQYTGENTTKHWGVCTINLKDGDLVYQGVRLGAKPELDQEKQLWYSIFSKLTCIPSQSSTGKPDAYFGYGLHSVPSKDENNYHLCKLESLNDIDASNGSILESQGQSEDTSLNKGARTELHEYLVKGHFERDKQTLINTLPESQADDVAAVAHINLEEWNRANDSNPRKKEKRGHVQPVIPAESPTDHNQKLYPKNPGTIWFYQLLPSE